MSIDPRTPVLVGVGAVQQRLDDPLAALEPVELMIAALRRAADDAGAGALLAKTDSIWVPRGFWDYADPGRIIADRIGAARARTRLAEIGVLQTTLFGRAVRAIATGEEDVVVVAGGEAKHRSLRAQIAGVTAPLTPQSEAQPDEVLWPAREIWSPLEEEVDLLMPVRQYAVMETALRRAEGLGVAEHRREVARLWADFSLAAAENPLAWNREPVSAEVIGSSSARNRMLAFPYGKLHNSQWNVDQAAALIFTSAAAARAAGIDERGWIFPLAVAESDYMVPLSQRAELHRSHGFRLAGERAFATAGAAIDDVEHLELYSCFPVAVRIQARELGVRPGRRLTLTGGMAFAGGPLNNFVLQALVRMAEVLRRRGGSGLLTAVSGMLTKQGVSLWSSQAPARPCVWTDVSAAAAEATATVEVLADYAGPATVASYTVLFEGDSPARAVLLCDLADGHRAFAVSEDPALLTAMTEEEFCGRAVHIGVGRQVG